MYPNQQQNPADQTSNFFWLLILIFIVFIGLWFFHPEWIVRPIFFVRRLELDLMMFLGHGWNAISALLHLPGINLHNLDAVDREILNAAPKSIRFDEFFHVNILLGNWLRWPVMGILFVLACLIYSQHSVMRFRHRYDMAALKQAELENWPQIEPVARLDLVKQDLFSGPWAMSVAPLTFAKQGGFLELAEKEGQPIWAIDKKIAKRQFALQLGPLWPSTPTALPIHIQALAVIFIARIERDNPKAHHFLSQIAYSARSGKLNFAGVTEQWQRYQQSKVFKWLLPRHAYIRTLMASLLDLARQNGVLATAEFLWLKPLDRPLWYTLNSVGRQTAVVEVSGVFGHWKAEKMLKRAIKTPMVDTAVDALSVAVEDVLYVAESEQWHSSAD